MWNDLDGSVVLCGHTEPHQQHSKSVQPCMLDAAEKDEDVVLSSVAAILPTYNVSF